MNLLKNNVALLSITGFDILLMIFNQVQVANYFGATAQRDSYFLANTLIVFLFTIHYRSVVLFFLPKHVLYLNGNKKRGLAYSFVWIYLVLIVLLSFLLILLIYLIITSGYSPFRNSDFLFKLLIILLTGFVFQTGTSMQSAVYHSNNQFIFPASQKLFVVLTMITSVYCFHDRGIEVLAWGYLIGNIICFCFLLIGKFQSFIRDLNVKNQLIPIWNFFKQVIPFISISMIGLTIHLIEPLFVANDASGTISYLGYSYRIVLILLTMVSASIITTFYTRISLLHTRNDAISLRKEVLKTLQIIFIFCSGIAGFLFLYGFEFIKVAFERGSFSEKDSFSVYIVLRWELIVFVFGAMNLLLNRYFYLKNNKKVLFSSSILSLAVYILAASTLYTLLGYEGLGIALGISSVIYFMISISVAVKSLKLEPLKLLSFFSKTTAYILIAIIILWIVRPYLAPINHFTQMLVGGMLYLVILLAFSFSSVKKILG